MNAEGLRVPLMNKHVNCIKLGSYQNSLCTAVITVVPLVRSHITCSLFCCGFCIAQNSVYGPGSSDGIATDYGLDGLGLNPGGNKIFRPFRPALGPIQPPVQWVPGLSRG